MVHILHTYGHKAFVTFPKIYDVANYGERLRRGCGARQNCASGGKKRRCLRQVSTKKLARQKLVQNATKS